MSSSNEVNVDQDAEKFVDEIEYGSRSNSKLGKVLIPLVAGTWSLFQLALPKFVLLSSEYIRCIHLAFAIFLIYLSFPAFKKGPFFKLFSGKFGLNWLTQKKTIPFVDILLGIFAATASVYLLLDYEGIATRQGAPILRDLVLGVITIGLLLEAARRALGPALPTIASVFIFYSFFSESMPEVISFKNASLSKVVNKLTLGTEGVFGVPLDVSASVVFLFVLFGAILDKVGGGQYFIQLAYSLLGRFKGGPGKAAVLASGFTGMISGSSIANTVTTGTFTIPLMKKAGYPAVKAGAIEVAASTNGQLMPPIMGAAAFIIAEYCNLSYFEVVRAAIIPALISYIALIYITHLEACKLGLDGVPKEELPRFWKVFFGGIHFLIPLGFLLYQLIIMRRSAQLSAFYGIIALCGTILVRNLWFETKEGRGPIAGLKLSATQFWESLVAGGKNMMSIGVAVAAAGIIVGIVTLGLGGVITDVIDLIAGGNLAILLIITAAASLLLGMGLPTTANYIVMASLTVPAIVVLGEDAGLTVPLIAAHLFCFYFGILADDTPPVGLAAYAAAAISKADPIKTGLQGFAYDIRTAILPFMFIFNTELLLIGVESVWHGLAVFFTAMMGMFAFANLTQNYFVSKNKIWESAVFIIITISMLRPSLISGWTGVDRTWAYFIGFAGYFLVWVSQRKRAHLPIPSAAQLKA